ncbi:fused DSP-PTPase phosphatase/NAD kinase-like protein [uncultured Clostridium sp.]|uniref:phosphatase domain-containing putative toxin n=1 Tax=uncultured Clostridium sp. TaxID=59620 RepID=UPI0026708DC4|nr:phosphatase [uncultured Clostridium sp.]
MKNITLKVISFISLFLLFTSLISSKPLCFTSKKNESIITIDSTSSVGLPMRLRDIPTLNISGSAQFTKDQLLNLKNYINKDNICIVDLRQESHGMINDLAISFLNPYKDLNNGFTTEQTIKAENSLLNKIKIGNTIQLYKHTGIFIKDITVDFISNESQLVTEADMQYKRFAVKDNSAPTPDIVDEFVEFIKNKPDDIHLHFHCAAGKGRTTSFMVMYQAMKNNSNLTLEQLLSYQYNIGGVNLHDNNIQYNFLEDFCNYVQKNKDSNYSISYSQWIKES